MKIFIAATFTIQLISGNIIAVFENFQNSSKKTSYRNFDNNVFNNNQVASIFGDYGCWCHFQSNNGYVGNGFGGPVDEMDELCKKLHDQYSCIKNDNEFCDPWTVNYNLPNFNAGFNGVSEADVVNECGNFNSGDDCAKNACIVESSFFRIYFQSGIQLNRFFEHDVFDASSQCNLGNGFSSWSVSRGEKQCCGSYPNRSINYDGGKGCCAGEVVYSLSLKQCCGDGVVKGVVENC